MRQFVNLFVAAGLLSSVTTVFADMDMLKKYNCMACHQVDRKVFGPAFKDVAAKYSGDEAAPDKLAKVIRRGSSGVWSEAPMPPQAQVPDADAQLLVTYILSLK